MAQDVVCSGGYSVWRQEYWVQRRCSMAQDVVCSEGCSVVLRILGAVRMQNGTECGVQRRMQCGTENIGCGEDAVWHRMWCAAKDAVWYREYWVQ